LRAVRIRRLLVLGDHELPPDCADLRGMRAAQAPPRDIDFVNPLVAEIAVARVPEPVPVVMEAVAIEWTFRRRTKPQVVVDVRQIRAVVARFRSAADGERERLAALHRAVGVSSDGVAPLVAEAASQ